MDGLKRYLNDDHFRVDGDKNMRLLAFDFTIVFVWTGSRDDCCDSFYSYFKHLGNQTLCRERSRERSRVRQLYHMGCGSDNDPSRSFSIPYKYHKFTMFNITIAVYRPRSRVMSYIK